MKKILILMLLLVLKVTAFGQKVDTVINKGIYKSYFSNGYRDPLYVTYEVYKAGGTCDRSKQGFRFNNDLKIPAATQKDYAGSGYDEGHMADAADFSGDCIKEEATFRFYNALPQTPNLNRGIWKHWETDIRKESQHNKLFIICGGIFTAKSKKIGSGVFVPDYCWKIVINEYTKKVEHILLFTNNMDNNTVKEITLNELLSMSHFPINMNY